MLLPAGDLRPVPLRPVAWPVGGPLLISDSPEYVPGPGILALGQALGQMRILYHHVNATDQPLWGAVAVRNPGGVPLRVDVAACGACAGLDYMGCGAAATAAFLERRAAPAFTGIPAGSLVPPGAWAVWPSRPLATGELWTALLALRLSGPGEIYTLMAPPAALSEPGSLPLLPPAGPQERGVQPFGQRWLVMRHRVSAGTAGVQLANPPTGPPGTWAEPLPGEYLPSVDAATGTAALIAGNYGVTYHLGFQLHNDTTRPTRIQVALNPRGGPYFGPLAAGEAVYLPPRPVAAPAEAWTPAGVTLTPGEQRWSYLRFVPAGASFLPVRLLLVPLSAAGNASAAGNGRVRDSGE